MKFWQVDAFTKEVFKGNPAGVIITDQEIDEELMQNIAMEMNLSETAFVLFNKNSNINSIRWFTPNSEVNLCGHATLSAAHILWEKKYVNDDHVIKFDSKSGILSVTKTTDGYTLDFPAQEAKEKDSYYDLITNIVRHKPVFVGSNNEDCLVVLDNSELLLNYIPKHDEIYKLEERGLVISAPDDTGNFDYIYRTFYPKLNVSEDPVTGSANTCLAPYWSNVLDKCELKAKQVSTRTGDLTVEVDGNRVLITGQAITVFEANI